MEPLRKETDLAFEEALERVPEALATEGFGVLTRIDIQDTLKQKLGVDFRPYRILGACNPQLAHKALTSRLDVGTMLPCNVVVHGDDRGKATVLAIDPMATIAAAASPELSEIAAEVRARLSRVLARLP